MSLSFFNCCWAQEEEGWPAESAEDEDDAGAWEEEGASWSGGCAAALMQQWMGACKGAEQVNNSVIHITALWRHIIVVMTPAQDPQQGITQQI